MRAVVREFPLDADVLALSASAEMELCKLYYRLWPLYSYGLYTVVA